MIENQAPQIRDLRENGPENTVDLINSDVKSDHQDQQSPDDRRSSHASLFPRNESDDLRLRWHNIQGRFVDEPRHAVEEADQLVGFVIGRLAEIFADERYGLEQQWSKAKAASTEDLRKSLRQYRSFFDRLLSL